VIFILLVSVGLLNANYVHMSEWCWQWRQWHGNDVYSAVITIKLWQEFSQFISWMQNSTWEKGQANTALILPIIITQFCHPNPKARRVSQNRQWVRESYSHCNNTHCNQAYYYQQIADMMTEIYSIVWWKKDN